MCHHKAPPPSRKSSPTAKPGQPLLILNNLSGYPCILGSSFFDPFLVISELDCSCTVEARQAPGCTPVFCSIRHNCHSEPIRPGTISRFSSGQFAIISFFFMHIAASNVVFLTSFWGMPSLTSCPCSNELTPSGTRRILTLAASLPPPHSIEWSPTDREARTPDPESGTFPPALAPNA